MSAKEFTRRHLMKGAAAAMTAAPQILAARVAQSGEASPTAVNNVQVGLPPHRFANALLPDSVFGINMSISPDTEDVAARLRLMQRAGIKWGRQGFTWRRIEREQGQYDLDALEQLVDLCRKHGILVFGTLAYSPPFHDPRTPEGVEAFCAFARAVVKRFQGKVSHWQIWNEPNLSGEWWKGTPEEYARLLAASGRAIHEANPEAKVLGLNTAFIDVPWAERILKQVPYDCFDIAVVHPYRAPTAPEERYDYWVRDQLVDRWYGGKLTHSFPLIRMSMLEQTEELVKVMDRFGKPKPIWIGEIRWTTYIGPYGSTELRQADMLVRLHVLSIASGRIKKVFWWTIKDRGWEQTGRTSITGLARADLTPKYSYNAFAWMTRLLEGKRWLRNDEFGPDVYAVVFREDKTGEDTIVTWATKSFAYVRVNNNTGLTCYDIFGTKRIVSPGVQQPSITLPVGESPIYVVGRKGLKAAVRPDPGMWATNDMLPGLGDHEHGNRRSDS